MLIAERTYITRRPFFGLLFMISTNKPATLIAWQPIAITGTNTVSNVKIVSSSESGFRGPWVQQFKAFSSCNSFCVHQPSRRFSHLWLFFELTFLVCEKKGAFRIFMAHDYLMVKFQSGSHLLQRGNILANKFTKAYGQARRAPPLTSSLTVRKLLFLFVYNFFFKNGTRDACSIDCL